MSPLSSPFCQDMWSKAHCGPGKGGCPPSTFMASSRAGGAGAKPLLVPEDAGTEGQEGLPLHHCCHTGHRLVIPQQSCITDDHSSHSASVHWPCLRRLRHCQGHGSLTAGGRPEPRHGRQTHGAAWFANTAYHSILIRKTKQQRFIAENLENAEMNRIKVTCHPHAQQNDILASSPLSCFVQKWPDGSWPTSLGLPSHRAWPGTRDLAAGSAGAWEVEASTATPTTSLVTACPLRDHLLRGLPWPHHPPGLPSFSVFAPPHVQPPCSLLCRVPRIRP